MFILGSHHQNVLEYSSSMREFQNNCNITQKEPIILCLTENYQQCPDKLLRTILHFPHMSCFVFSFWCFVCLFVFRSPQGMWLLWWNCLVISGSVFIRKTAIQFLWTSLAPSQAPCPNQLKIMKTSNFIFSCELYLFPWLNPDWYWIAASPKDCKQSVCFLCHLLFKAKWLFNQLFIQVRYALQLICWKDWKGDSKY